MKLLLINPSRKKSSHRTYWDMDLISRTLDLHPTIPLALPTIASLTPQDVDVTIVDEVIEEIDFDTKVDLVGITSITPNITRAYEVADEFRKRNIKVVIGGIHVSMLPQEALGHADSVVVGEAEYIWRDLVKDFERGELKSIYRGQGYPDLSDTPIPRFDLLKSDKYFSNLVQTTRGCPFDCEFCSVKGFFGGKVRCKSVKQVIDEIRAAPKYLTIQITGHQLKFPKGFFITDDNIIGNKKYAQELFQALIPIKTTWCCQSSVNVGKDKEMLALMKEAGCETMFIGFESLTEDNLRQMGKRVNKVGDYQQIIENIHSYGINIICSFMVGNDSDDETVFEKIVDFIRGNHLVFCMINVPTPYPGTRLFKRLEREGRITNKDWEKFNVETVCFRSKRMSVKTLEEGRRWVYQQIYCVDKLLEGLDKFSTFSKYSLSMPLYEKLFLGFLILKVLLSVKGEERKFLLSVIKRTLVGVKVDWVTCVHIMNCLDYVSTICKNKLVRI